MENTNDMLEMIDGKLGAIDEMSYDEALGFFKDEFGCVEISQHTGKGIVLSLGDEYVIKIFTDRAVREGSVDTPYLERLKGVESAPKLYLVCQRAIVMEKVRGELVVDFLTGAGEDEISNVSDDFESAVARMLESGVRYNDIKIGDHFIIDKYNGSLRIIDFGNCWAFDAASGAGEIAPIARAKRKMFEGKLREALSKSR